jgi:hypothetical protein
VEHVTVSCRSEAAVERTDRGSEPMGLLRLAATVTVVVMLGLTVWVGQAWGVLAAAVVAGYGLPAAVLLTVQVTAILATPTPDIGRIASRVERAGIGGAGLDRIGDRANG